MTKGIGSLFLDLGSTRGPAFKYAAAENPDRVQLEQDFGSMAFLFVTDRAARLIPHMIGFEVVDQDEDGGRAVGLFGFKIGESYYYVPCFFLEGRVKGMDSIYSRDSNSFMPLIDEQIDELIAGGNAELGKPGPPRASLADVENPSLRFAYEPPSGMGNKTASAPCSLPSAWAAMRDSVAEAFEKDAAMAEDFSNFVSLAYGGEVEKKASGGLRDWLAKSGSPADLAALGATMTGNPGYLAAALSLYDSPAALIPDRVNPLVKRAAPLRIVGGTPDRDATEAQRADMVVHGWYLDDKRASAATVIDVAAYDYHTPTDAGRYEVVMRGGDTRDLIAFKGIGTGKSFLLADAEGPDRAVAGASGILATGKAPGKLPEGVKGDDVRIGNTYIFFGEDGAATPPVEIVAVFGDGEGGSYLSVRAKYVRTDGNGNPGGLLSNPSGPCLSRWPDGGRRPASAEDISEVSFSDDVKAPVLDSISDFRSRAVLPSSWRALLVSEKREKHRDTACDPVAEARRERKEIRVGDMSDVDLFNRRRGLRRLEVSNDGKSSDYRIEFGDAGGETRGEKEAAAAVVMLTGVRMADAEGIVRRARGAKAGADVLPHKLAQAVSVINPPQPDEEDPTVDPYLRTLTYPMTNEQTTYGATVGQPEQMAPGDPGYNEAPPEGAAGNPMAAEVAQIAESAARLGQRTVFDHASVGGLAKTHDTAAVIDSYIPEMLRSLDRLGRVSFLYYWKNSDISDRYGAGDMPGIEDLLRGVYKSFGELVLKLKKKSVEGSGAANYSV